MDRLNLIDQLSAANTHRVLELLTVQQHLRPSRSVGNTIEKICLDEGYGAATASAVLSDLASPPDFAMGRLSRVQVRSLAQRIALTWQTSYVLPRRPQAS